MRQGPRPLWPDRPRAGFQTSVQMRVLLDATACRGRLFQKRGAQGGVNKIGHDRFGRQRIKRDAEFRLTLHPEGRGVHDRGRIFQHVPGLHPIMHDDLGTEFRTQRLSPVAGAVGKADFWHADLDQRSDHGPRAAASANNGGGPR